VALSKANNLYYHIWAVIGVGGRLRGAELPFRGCRFHVVCGLLEVCVEFLRGDTFFQVKLFSRQ